MSNHTSGAEQSFTDHLQGPGGDPCEAGVANAITRCFTGAHESRSWCAWKRRAETAEARAALLEQEVVKLRRDSEVCRQENLQARNKMTCWKSQFQQTRKKLMALRAQEKRFASAKRRERENGRLKSLLEELGVDARKHSTNVKLRLENGCLREECCISD